jgi:ABC-type antimicrobial peptide transport system permease subunit
LVRGALLPVGIGAAAALLLAVPLVRGLAALLYEVKPWDPASWTLALVLLAAAATVAAWLPARRAAAIDPMRSLRAE